jgi:predicted nucleic acid-binding protein
MTESPLLGLGMPDTNVLMDIAGPISAWRDWSLNALEPFLQVGLVVINVIIYAELAAGYERAEELDAALPAADFRRDDIPWEAAFLAGQAHLAYRRRGGARTTTLPDFFIGAHALVRGHTLITRDPRRYCSYFPDLKLIAPGS